MKVKKTFLLLTSLCCCFPQQLEDVAVKIPVIEIDNVEEEDYISDLDKPNIETNYDNDWITINDKVLKNYNLQHTYGRFEKCILFYFYSDKFPWKKQTLEANYVLNSKEIFDLINESFVLIKIPMGECLYQKDCYAWFNENFYFFDLGSQLPHVQFIFINNDSSYQFHLIETFAGNEINIENIIKIKENNYYNGCVELKKEN